MFLIFCKPIKNRDYIRLLHAHVVCDSLSVALLDCGSRRRVADIKDSEAIRYVGKSVEVRGFVVSVKISPLGTAFINLGQDYPNQTFAGFIRRIGIVRTETKTHGLPIWVSCGSVPPIITGLPILWISGAKAWIWVLKIGPMNAGISLSPVSLLKASTLPGFVDWLSSMTSSIWSAEHATRFVHFFSSELCTLSFVATGFSGGSSECGYHADFQRLRATRQTGVQDH